MKLTDAQLVILSAAAKRDDGKLLPLPKSIRFNKASATTVLKSLVKHGLAADAPAAAAEDAWREAKDGQRLTLTITGAGLSAVGIESDRPGEKTSGDKKGAGRRSSEPQIPNAKASKGLPKAATVRPGTKLALLIDLLKRKTGATVEEAAKATRWQKHSVRGAMSGALKKKLGLTINSTEEARGRVYRVAAR